MNTARWIPCFLGLSAALILSACHDDGGGGSEAPNLDLGGPAAGATGEFAYDLTVVFTNDFHDQILPAPDTRGGMARHGTLMKALRSQASERGKALIALNAGDCFEGSLFYERDGGASLLRVLDHLGYDAMQVGNHDHQFGSQRLFDVIQSAFPGQTPNLQFLFGNVNPGDMYVDTTQPYSGLAAFTPAPVTAQVVAAFENVFTDLSGTVDPTRFDPPGSRNHLFNQTLMFEKSGVRVGVFGLDTDEVLYTAVPGEGGLLQNPGGISENLRFYDPTAANYLAAVLTWFEDPDGDPQTDDGADVIIAVTHVGLEVDRLIAAAAQSASGRRIDVIIGGHDHFRVNTAVPVTHSNGQTTHIVQAGSKGAYLGRVDLSIDQTSGAVWLEGAELLEVTDAIPEDPETQGLIASLQGAPGGIDEFYSSPYDSVVTTSDGFLSGEVAGPSALGHLVADACLSEANAAASPAALDAVLLGNFVFRSDLMEGPLTVADIHAVLPLHIPDATGVSPDAIDIVELTGGLRQATDLAMFPFPSQPLQAITQLEYFLEVIYGIEDIANLVAQVFSLDVGGVSQYVAGLQWAGIEFEVNLQAPLFQRIDPASIRVQGVPLLGNENRTYRIGINAIIARYALPFMQFLLQVEDPPGSSQFIAFPTYDPLQAATTVVPWEALRQHLAITGTVTGSRLRVAEDRPRTLGPDLTFNPIEVTVNPSGVGLNIELPILNLGGTATTGASIRFRLDQTPEVTIDNPDGITDATTGYSFLDMGSFTVPAVPAFQSGQAGRTVVNFQVPLPVPLVAGDYFLIVDLDQVGSATQPQIETVLSNNGGYALRIPFNLSQPLGGF